MTAAVTPTSQAGERSATGLRLERFRPRIGALVSGVDLAEPLDDATKVRLQKGLLERGVLSFRDQKFAPVPRARRRIGSLPGIQRVHGSSHRYRPKRANS